MLETLIHLLGFALMLLTWFVAIVGLAQAGRTLREALGARFSARKSAAKRPNTRPALGLAARRQIA